MRIRYKEGVRLHDLTPQIVLAIQSAAAVWQELGAPELVVTSCNDGIHRETSLHWCGMACDLRIWNLPEDRRRLAVSELERDLPPDFDVILESDHVHLEYQPRLSSRRAP